MDNPGKADMFQRMVETDIIDVFQRIVEQGRDDVFYTSKL